MPENFYFLKSNLIPATENKQAPAGFLTADTAGQRDEFFSSPRVFLNLKWRALAGLKLVAFCGL